MKLQNGGLLTKFLTLYDPTTKLGNFTDLYDLYDIFQIKIVSNGMW